MRKNQTLTVLKSPSLCFALNLLLGLGPKNMEDSHLVQNLRVHMSESLQGHGLEGLLNAWFRSNP